MIYAFRLNTVLLPMQKRNTTVARNNKTKSLMPPNPKSSHNSQATITPYPHSIGKQQTPLIRGTGGLPLSKKHLRTYTRRNTADFFIHKDLSGFLNRELDIYIKNEVLPLSDLILTNVKNGGGGSKLLVNK